MVDYRFPKLDTESIVSTRDALHAYSRVIGGWAASCRRRRKHWWHASLRPSLFGLRTGVIYANTDFELEVDFANSMLRLQSCSTCMSERLVGQPSSELDIRIRHVLGQLGIDQGFGPADEEISEQEFPDYSPDTANRLHRAFGSVAAALEDFRADLREEKSPIQVWPHHFDLAMIWLPGQKVAGQPLDNEEYSDKQMNFGFVLGDTAIAEPYFYVTAYPLPEGFPGTKLPSGTTWHSEGFTGAVALYRDVASMNDPHGYLLEMWNVLVEAGRKHFAIDEEHSSN